MGNNSITIRASVYMNPDEYSWQLKVVCYSKVWVSRNEGLTYAGKNWQP